MGSLKFSQQYGNNKISVNQNQKVVTLPVDVVEPGDKHFIGVVQEITEEKFICSASELSDLIECIKGCNAEVGDEVIICLMQDGQYVVVARVGGDLGGGTGGGDVGGVVPPEYGSTTDYIAGKVFAFAGNLVPAGCLLCDGREVSRSEYWELFAAIGTLYGAGDGSTTFNLPNIESRTIIGESDTYALGAVGGEEKHKLTIEETAEHPGHLQSNNGVSDLGNNTRYLAEETLGSYGSVARGWYDVGNEIYPAGCSRGGNQPHNNMQPYIVMRYFITTGKADPASGINPADYLVEWGKWEGGGTCRYEKYASGRCEIWGTISNQFFTTASSTRSFTVNLPFTVLQVESAVASSWSPKDVNHFGSVDASIRDLAEENATSFKLQLAWTETAASLLCGFVVKGTWKDSPASGGTETIAPTIAEKFEKLETDYIVAEGTSGMWTYRKWASGTAECWGEEEFNAGTTVAWGNVFTSTNGSSNFSFPFAFTDSPEIFGEFLAPNGNATISAVPPSGTEKILSNFWPVWPTKVTSDQMLTLHVYVIGRWK